MDESTKHSPRIDEQLKHEEGGDRAEERLRNQGPTEDEHLPSEGARHDLDDVVDLSGVEERSDIARFLEPSRFPASREDLIDAAREHFAPVHVLETLSELPEDSTAYGNVQQVWEALGGTAEERF
ncbi:MAG: DUF2795 domain-containing protein [Acidimicrobiia bacterium]